MDDKVLELRSKGLTIAHISGALGIKYNSVRRVLVQKGVVGPNRKTWEWNDALTKRALDLKGSGLTWVEVSDEMDVPTTVLRRKVLPKKL